MATIDLELTEHPDTNFATSPQYAVKLTDWIDGKDGRPLVSNRCKTIEEFGAEVVRLKSELDRILLAAKHQHQKYSE
jgi:hypothetical protein